MSEKNEWHVEEPDGIKCNVVDQALNVIAQCNRYIDAKMIVELHEQHQRKPQPFTCFSCRDGNTPLYCLNCATDILRAKQIP